MNGHGPTNAVRLLYSRRSSPNWGSVLMRRSPRGSRNRPKLRSSNQPDNIVLHGPSELDPVNSPPRGDGAGLR